MPYRRLPKTDAARLKALKTLLDNNDIYTVKKRFIDWKDLNKAQNAHNHLLTACQQYKVCMSTQVRNSKKHEKVQRKAAMYLSHFLQVLFLAVERGEIKRQHLKLYGLDPEQTILPPMKTPDTLMEWADKIIKGEKERTAKGGRPIFNPTIGMVSTHVEIFRDALMQQRKLQERTQQTLNTIQALRPETDELLLSLWNQIEKHYENEPPEIRYDACRRLGVIYYYRRHEEHLY